MKNKRTSGSAGPAALTCAMLVAAVCAAPANAASDQQQQQSVEVLQGTVINLLQALVQRGVITQQQAEQMVKQAQDKANADFAAGQAKERAQREQEEKEGAIAVPYVPQIVQQKIEKQVAAQVQPAVTADVLKQAKQEGWGVPGALPDWIRDVRVTGDLTIRGQDNLYGSGNSAGCPTGTPYGNCTILNYAAVNAAGGITQAGEGAYLNVNQDNAEFQARARLGVDVTLSQSWDAGIRIATGALNSSNSEVQTFNSEFGRYQVGFDRIYLRWRGATARGFNYLSVVGGKFDDPFFTPTTLIYSKFVNFDGVAMNGKLGIGDGGAQQSFVFMNLGGFPVQEVPLVFQNSKWLVGGQLGISLRSDAGQQLTVAGAYYDFDHVQGRMNSLESVLNNYTEPTYATYGNSYCDIADDPTFTTQTFALCSQYRIADVSAGYVLPIGRYALELNADAVRNLGFNLTDISNIFSGAQPESGRNGYQGEVGFGDPDVYERWAWRGIVGYRYVQGDAVLDALTDADFHLGGTDAQGYFMRADFGLAHNVWTRLSYYAGDQITGPRYQVDVLQLDLNARF